MSGMATPAPEKPIQVCLKVMRATLSRLEGLGIPAVDRLTLDLRHQMIELTTRFNELEATAAAKRMTGEAEQLKVQAPLDEEPLFAVTATQRSLSAEELERRMLRARHREADHTQDPESGDQAGTPGALLSGETAEGRLPSELRFAALPRAAAPPGEHRGDVPPGLIKGAAETFEEDAGVMNPGETPGAHGSGETPELHHSGETPELQPMSLEGTNC